MCILDLNDVMFWSFRFNLWIFFFKKLLFFFFKKLLFFDFSLQQVAGHELKGLKAYFSLGMTDIRVPIMALVDYRGFRLIAMSVLPVSGNSLVYGSKDAGYVWWNDSLDIFIYCNLLSLSLCGNSYTVRKSNARFNQLMKAAGKRLNLKPHRCGVRPNKTKVT